MTDRLPLVTATQRGLYCPPGDFYIDPAKPVQTAVVTHAHGDHLRAGSARILLAAAGLGIARKRLNDARNVVAMEYGAPFNVRARDPLAAPGRPYPGLGPGAPRA